MQHFKTLLTIVLVVALGAAAGSLLTRYLMTPAMPPDVETLAAPLPQLAAHAQPVLFTLSTCPACRQTKDWMRDNAVEFVEYSVDTDAAARALAQTLDIESVPVLFVGSHRINGFHPDALARYAKAAGGG
jgi:glutaredoxin 3